MRYVGLLVGMVASYLVGCYHPELRDCTVQCNGSADCTGGQICRDDGWCAMPGLDKCPEHQDPGDTVDSAVATTNDAPSQPDLCALGCSMGSCVDGVCVIDCSAAGACQNEVHCPANLPCRVVCGDNACAKPIKCDMALSCEVRCVGDHACGDEIQCNGRRCDVECSGPSSCEKRTRCAGSCACDVRCTGVGSCIEPSECPASTCKLGNGCTSLVAGCDDC